MTTLIRSGSAASKVITTYQASVCAPVSLSGRKKVTPVVDHHTDIAAIAATKQPSAIPSSGPFSSTLAAKNIVLMSRRFAHTDVTFPNFDSCRRDCTLDPTQSSKESEDQRRSLNPAIYYGVGGMLSLIAAKEVIQLVVMLRTLKASERALLTIEVDLNEIPEGKTKTYEWRGKPLFVKHRTQAEIDADKHVAMADLRHPEPESSRIHKEEWAIVIGVCTHLGCIPFANSGDYGGYFCPCHGSHYDSLGRIRKGPAPLNLHVPPYAFKDNIAVIGATEA